MSFHEDFLQVIEGKAIRIGYNLIIGVQDLIRKMYKQCAMSKCLYGYFLESIRKEKSSGMI